MTRGEANMAVTYDELYRYYHELRHFCDEYKAF